MLTIAYVFLVAYMNHELGIGPDNLAWWVNPTLVAELIIGGFFVVADILLTAHAFSLVEHAAYEIQRKRNK